MSKKQEKLEVGQIWYDANLTLGRGGGIKEFYLLRGKDVHPQLWPDDKNRYWHVLHFMGGVSSGSSGRYTLAGAPERYLTDEDLISAEMVFVGNITDMMIPKLVDLGVFKLTPVPSVSDEEVARG